MQWQEFRPHFRHLSAKDIKRLETAFELGKKMHTGQKRRSGEPYFNHPIAVAHMLSDVGADADTLIAALLHDTVEDTPLTLEDIDAQFGGSVTALIDGVTKLSSKDVAMSPKLDEQIETLRKIFTLMQQDVRIMVIKLVDRLHNMQTVEFLPPERQQLLAHETLEVFVKIADKLCMQDLRDELEALCLSVLEPEIYSELVDLKMHNEQRGIGVMKDLKEGLASIDKSLTQKTGVHFGYKTWDQLKAQRTAGSAIVTGMSFITAVFVTEDIDMCYRVLGALHQRWKRETLSFQDFINSPQLNGYRGLHTTIIAQDGTRVRCKIRTREMEDYAKKGVTTVCFKGISEFGDILPWTKRLSPLTTDTEGSSNDFWLNLKSDILGESFTIHGPGDTTVQLPKGATALDGAFYLLQENALRTSSVKANGVEVPFGTALANAASLDVILSDQETSTREWLRQVHTGFAAAAIRQSLMKHSEEEKLTTGRAMLQQIFSERKRGFIEEFDEKTLLQQLLSFGYSTMSDLYISIADGRLEPAEVYASLFEKPRSKNPRQIRATLIRYTIPMDALELMDRINLVHRKYGTGLLDITYKRQRNSGNATVSLRVRLLPQELLRLEQDLVIAGATELRVRHRPTGIQIIGICGMILLWGLDPVLSKILLHRGIDAPTFAFVRSWSVFAFSLLALFLINRRKTGALVRIPLHHISLWTAGISFFLVNLLTYYFLREGSPLLYNTILRANAILLTLPLLKYRELRQPVSIAIVVGLAGLACTIAGPFNIDDLLLAGLIVAMFSLYTSSTATFQSLAHIQARYAQLFASTSLIGALASVCMLAFVPIHVPATAMLITVIFYSILFIAVPYIVFNAIMDNVGYAALSPWINSMVVVTLPAQFFLLHDTTGFAFLIPAMILFIIASSLASKTKRMAENR